LHRTLGEGPGGLGVAPPCARRATRDSTR